MTSAVSVNYYSTGFLITNLSINHYNESCLLHYQKAFILKKKKKTNKSHHVLLKQRVAVLFIQSCIWVRRGAPGGE